MSIRSIIAHYSLLPISKSLIRWQLSYSEEEIEKTLLIIRRLEDSTWMRRIEDLQAYYWTRITIDKDRVEEKSEWIRYKHMIAPPIKSGILFLHGGGFIAGMPSFARLITVYVAEEVNAVFVPYYRKPPEDPFPAALEDALNAYQMMVREVGDRLVIMGDSAGAGLALSTYLTLKKNQRLHNLPLPRGLVLLSPWIDLSGETTLSVASNNDHDSLIPIESIPIIGGLYTTGKAEKIADHIKNDPLISPFHQEDQNYWKDMPPTLVQYASEEALAADAKKLAELAGDQVILDEIKDGWHSCQYFGKLLPEAEQALSRVSRFISNIVK